MSEEADYYSSRKFISSVDDEEIKEVLAQNNPYIIKRISKSN